MNEFIAGNWVVCLHDRLHCDCDYPAGNPVTGKKYRIRQVLSPGSIRVEGFSVWKNGTEISFGPDRFKPCDPPDVSDHPNDTKCINPEFFLNKPLMENNDYNDIAIATPTLIYGKDLEKMSENQLIESMKFVQAKIESLKSIPGNSRKIQREIGEAEKALDKLVGQLDKDEVIP